jgi:tRNA 2-thiouridine synthesizing protein B
MPSSAAEHGVLHLVFASPAAGDALQLALTHARGGDAVVLLQDAVLAASAHSLRGDLLWQHRDEGVAVHALMPDLAARGIASTDCRDGIAGIDDADLVALVAAHGRCVSWW